MKKLLTIIIAIVLIVLAIYFVESRKCLSFLQVARFSSSEAVEVYTKECKKPSVILKLFK